MIEKLTADERRRLEDLFDQAALPVIVLTAFGSVPSAVECIKAGAFEFMEKPADTDELVRTQGEVAANLFPDGTQSFSIRHLLTCASRKIRKARADPDHEPDARIRG